MGMKRERVAVLLSVMVLLAVGSASSATIQSMSATDLDTSFTASDGLLSIFDNADIVVEDTLGGQNTYVLGEFGLNTSLQTDTSSGGIASGSFVGGALSFIDSGDNALLTGNIVYLELVEAFDGWGILTGQGQFEVTGGILEPDFALSLGNIVQITFNVSPGSISNFSADFTGSSNITVMPIPEPATICLLGLGALGLLRRRKSAYG